MSEKKVIGRNVGIALGILCIILVAGIAGAVANYTMVVNNKDNIIQTKDSEIQTLTNQKNQLQTWLTGNITNLGSQITSLQNQLNTLKAPKLISALNSEDVHTGTWHLHVWGAVWNVGTDTAYNCRIHVVAYQDSTVRADTYIILGTISGEGWKWVDENPVYYVGGGALASWTLTLEWTTTP